MPDPHTNSCCNYSDLIEFIHSLKLLCLSSSHSLPVRAGASIDGVGRDRAVSGAGPGVSLCPLSCWEMPNPPRGNALLTPAPSAPAACAPRLGWRRVSHFDRKITSNRRGNSGTKVTNRCSVRWGGSRKALRHQSLCPHVPISPLALGRCSGSSETCQVPTREKRLLEGGS